MSWRRPGLVVLFLRVLSDGLEMEEYVLIYYGWISTISPTYIIIIVEILYSSQMVNSEVCNLITYLYTCSCCGY